MMSDEHSPTHDSPPPEWAGDGWTDLGSGHWLRPFHENGRPDVVAGYHIGHWHADGEWCMGSVNRKGHGHGHAEWDVLSEDPLTLHPSIAQFSSPGDQCTHGWIRDGRWVAA